MSPLYMQVQHALVTKGYKPGPIDGIPGMLTASALKAFQKAMHADQSGVADAQTLAALGIDLPTLIDPPWLAILKTKQGLREVADKKALEAWLKSDGHTLGDPAKLPWCGDAIETSVLNAGFGPVPSNPYYALNWSKFGVHADLFYGGICAFWRGSPTSGTGHVAIVIGISADGKRLRIKGGNQLNMICDVWIEIGRLVDCRAPAHYAGPHQPLPTLRADGEPLSTNEA